jgi:predicted glycosyltransferase involved in capsule biosynthesis
MKISFCTTCMGRLFHLRQTCPKNIEHASSYENAEFVLLDYGSNDGLEAWVENEMSNHIKSGRLSYYKTKDSPKYFVASHAKNIAHRLASGDILCNLDSDILIPDGFCQYIESVFKAKPNSIIAFDSEDLYGNHGCAGMVISRREHFYSVNGYDEEIRIGWGYDDMNFQFRCRMHNSLELFTPPKMCLSIPHSNEVRTMNFEDKDIQKTMKMSMDICEKAAAQEDYVANKSVQWGECLVFKNMSKEVIKS